MNRDEAIQALFSGTARGVARWNQCRTPEVWGKAGRPGGPLIDLKGAPLKDAFLHNASLYRVDLTGADLRHAKLRTANLTASRLDGAKLGDADFSKASLNAARVHDAPAVAADFHGANLRLADFSGSDLRFASFHNASLTRAKFKGARLDGCRVFGASVWDVDLEGASQKGLIITPPDEPEITVDNFKVAQFVYLLLNNQEIRDVIDTITSRAVLILGRFSANRKTVLDALREALRGRGYSPILFDFEKPASRSYRETISTLAHMSRFVIADLTEAKVVLQELERIVPDLPSVPVQPILQAKARETSVVETDYSPYPWFLPVIRYRSSADVARKPLDAILAAADSAAKTRVHPRAR